MPRSRRVVLLCHAITLLPLLSVSAQAGAPLFLAPDAPQWQFEGNIGIAQMGGRQCLQMSGGQASIADLVLQDGIIDLQALTTGTRGFFGIAFRSDSLNGEYVYLRPHKSGLPDAIQYTPILNTGLNWQLYSGDGFTRAVDIPRDTWIPLRLEIRGTTARLFVGDTLKPALEMPDLKSGVRRGSVSLAVLMGTTCFSEVTVRALPDAPWQPVSPPMPAHILTSWQLSPSFEANSQPLEGPLTPAHLDSMTWEEVTAEAPGLVAISRHRMSPHPRVTFQSNFSTRLQPQPGSTVVFARTTINVDRAQLRKLHLGYSDEVTVFLNGIPLFRGRSAQSFRDPGFLGIMDVENDAVYLPLRAGRNELVLAVTELGGGWGFIARLAPDSTATP